MLRSFAAAAAGFYYYYFQDGLYFFYFNFFFLYFSDGGRRAASTVRTVGVCELSGGEYARALRACAYAVTHTPNDDIRPRLCVRTHAQHSPGALDFRASRRRHPDWIIILLLFTSDADNKMLNRLMAFQYYIFRHTVGLTSKKTTPLLSRWTKKNLKKKPSHIDRIYLQQWRAIPENYNEYNYYDIFRFSVNPIPEIVIYLWAFSWWHNTNNIRKKNNKN